MYPDEWDCFRKEKLKYVQKCTRKLRAKKRGNGNMKQIRMQLKVYYRCEKYLKMTHSQFYWSVILKRSMNRIQRQPRQISIK